MNCGARAYPAPKRGRNPYSVSSVSEEYDKDLDESKEWAEKHHAEMIGNEDFFELPKRKEDFDPLEQFQKPLEMILTDTGHESLTDLIRAYARLKAEKDSRLPDSLRGTHEGEQHESEMTEEAMQGFEERNADHLSNAFINWKRNQEGDV